MFDKSEFICYSTVNYSKLTNICLNSLQEINVNNINHVKDDYVVFGKNIYNINKSLVHHVISCRDVEQKFQQINEIKNIMTELGDTKIDLLKLDIEGSEINVLNKENFEKTNAGFILNL